MSQGPIPTNVAVRAGVRVPIAVNTDGSTLTANGTTTKTNITAAAVVKATAGRAVKVVVLDAGTTSGAFVINNCATTGAAATANEVWRLAYNATTNIAGSTFDLNIPCDTGIVVSAVPGGGTPRIAVVYS